MRLTKPPGDTGFRDERPPSASETSTKSILFSFLLLKALRLWMREASKHDSECGRSATRGAGGGAGLAPCWIIALSMVLICRQGRALQQSWDKGRERLQRPQRHKQTVQPRKDCKPQSPARSCNHKLDEGGFIYRAPVVLQLSITCTAKDVRGNEHGGIRSLEEERGKTEKKTPRIQLLY